MRGRALLCTLFGHRYSEQTEVVIFGRLMIAKLCWRCPKVEWVGPVRTSAPSS